MHGSPADGLYEPLLDEGVNGSGGVPMVFEPMSLEWDHVTALKASIVAHCPEISSDDCRDNPQSHHDCPRG